MQIILFLDKNGTTDGDCDFQELELLADEEVCVRGIVQNAVDSGRKLERVRVLTEKEYAKLCASADAWMRYLKYREAKETYDKLKDEFEWWR